jgi:hypothetical protein
VSNESELKFSSVAGSPHVDIGEEFAEVNPLSKIAAEKLVESLKEVGSFEFEVFPGPCNGSPATDRSVPLGAEGDAVRADTQLWSVPGPSIDWFD